MLVHTSGTRSGQRGRVLMAQSDPQICHRTPLSPQPRDRPVLLRNTGTAYAHRCGGPLSPRPLSPRPCNVAAPKGPAFCFLNYSRAAGLNRVWGWHGHGLKGVAPKSSSSSSVQSACGVDLMVALAGLHRAKPSLRGRALLRRARTAIEHDGTRSSSC